MCNELHEESRPIPASGAGLKMFSVDPASPDLFLPWLGPGRLYEADADGWITWQEGRRGDGFAFFRGPGEANVYYDYLCHRYETIWVGGKYRRHVPTWRSGILIVLQEIEYDSGLGEHREAGMQNCTIALCKRFRIAT
jgi:hypothetical protein